MGVFKNEVGRPSNEVLKTRKIIKTILLIIIIVFAFLGGYVINNYVSTKDVDDKTQNNINIESKTKKQIDKNEAKKILDNFVFDDYSLLVSEQLSNNYKTLLAIQKTKAESKNYTCKSLFGDDIELWSGAEHVFTINLSDDSLAACNDENDSFYDYLTVEKTYKKLFGNYSSPKKEYAESIFKGGQLIYGYSNLKNGYVELECMCGGVGHGEKNYIYESYQLNNELHIIFTYFNYLPESEYFDSNTGKELKLNISMDENYNIVGDVDKVFADNRGALPVYEIVFEKLNDNYIYRSLKQVK